MMAIVFSGFLFVLGSYAVVEAFPSAPSFASDPAPYTTAAERFIPPLAHVVTALFITSVAASFIVANTQTSRVIYNGAREGVWPQRLAEVHPRFRTPWLASLAFVLPSLALAFVGARVWDIGTASGFLATVGTLGLVLMYGLTNLGLVVLWFRERGHGRSHSPVTWLVVPMVGIAMMVFPFWANFQGGQAAPYDKLPIGFAVLAAVGIAYAVVLRVRRPDVGRNAGSLVMGEVTSRREPGHVTATPPPTTESV